MAPQNLSERQKIAVLCAIVLAGLGWGLISLERQKQHEERLAKLERELDEQIAGRSAEEAKEAEAARRKQQRYELELARIKREVSGFANQDRYAISEKAIQKNAGKADEALCERRLYLKLPLEGVPFHWVFRDKAQVLSGSLTLTLRRGEAAERIVIFENGMMSPNWDMLPCCADPGELYYGFATKKPHKVSEMETAEIELVANHDLDGIGPYSTGILKEGTYRSFTQPMLYHLETYPGEKDEYAFLNNDGWNILWKLQMTSDHGWKKKE